MIIKVIGAGCAECGRLYENTLAAACESGIPAIEIQKIEDLIEIVKLGVLSAPSLMIDGKLAVSGRVAKKDEILHLIRSSNA